MSEITDQDRSDAESCQNCPICQRAREKQKGLAYFFVKNVESGLCGKCHAYEKVYGRKAYEPIPQQTD